MILLRSLHGLGRPPLPLGRRRAPRRTAAASAVATLVGAALVALAPAARADEVYFRPSDGVFQLTGHGFGHGRGMSQWGAQGAALQGLTNESILGFYYPGTSRTSVANSTIRVRLTGDAAQLRVSATAGLAVVEASGTTTTLPTGMAQWRLVPVGSGLQLQGGSGSSWTPVAVSGSTEVTAPLTFTAPSDLLRVWRADGTSTDYRGRLTGIASGSSVVAVDALPLESYLRGVVPRESPASWAAAALQSQAVAARSYAVAKVNAAGSSSIYDICDTTACQVFSGTTAYSAAGAATSLEYASTDAAIAATAGVVLSYGGAVATTEFSASSGGWTAPGSVPYLLAREDPYDAVSAGNTSATWQATLPAAALESRYPAIGTLLRLVVTARNGYGDWGGRITAVRLEGSSGSVSITGEDVRAARPYPSASDGLRSSWFEIRNADASVVPATLAADESVWSPSRNYRLVVQADGNLVLYTAAGVAAWHAARFYPGSFLAVQADGNVVLYTAHGYPVWATMTTGTGNHLHVQDDGNVVLYTRSGAAVWDSRGYTGRKASTFLPPPEVSQLQSGAGIRSNNGSAWLVMQGDGNLVVYDRANRVPWNSGTFTPGSWMVRQNDGNLVVYRPSGDPAWASMTFASGTFLAIQDDGDVVLKDGSHQVLWDAFGTSGNPGRHFP